MFELVMCRQTNSRWAKQEYLTAAHINQTNGFQWIIYHDTITVLKSALIQLKRFHFVLKIVRIWVTGYNGDHSIRNTDLQPPHTASPVPSPVHPHMSRPLPTIFSHIPPHSPHFFAQLFPSHAIPVHYLWFWADNVCVQNFTKFIFPSNCFL